MSKKYKLSIPIELEKGAVGVSTQAEYCLTYNFDMLEVVGKVYDVSLGTNNMMYATVEITDKALEEKYNNKELRFSYGCLVQNDTIENLDVEDGTVVSAALNIIEVIDVTLTSHAVPWEK